MNHRKFTRANAYVIMRYTCPTSDNDEEIQTRIADISEQGLSAVTSAKGPASGTLVKMNFVIPGNKAHFVSVVGRVKHIDLLEKGICRLGVEFVDLGKIDQLAIQEYVVSLQKM